MALLIIPLGDGSLGMVLYFTIFMLDGRYADSHNIVL